jgi:hypothetical protein
MCLNYRTLYKLTAKNKCRFLRIDEFYDGLKGAQHFSGGGIDRDWNTQKATFQQGNGIGVDESLQGSKQFQEGLRKY